MAYQRLSSGTRATLNGERVVLLGYHVNDYGQYCDSYCYLRDGIVGRFVAACLKAWHSDFAFRLRSKEARLYGIAEGGVFPKWSLSHIISKPVCWIVTRAPHAPSHYFDVV